MPCPTDSRQWNTYTTEPDLENNISETNPDRAWMTLEQKVYSPFIEEEVPIAQSQRRQQLSQLYRYTDSEGRTPSSQFHSQHYSSANNDFGTYTQNVRPPRIESELRNTEELIEDPSLFGVPTFVVPEPSLSRTDPAVVYRPRLVRRWTHTAGPSYRHQISHAHVFSEPTDLQAMFTYPTTDVVSQDDFLEVMETARNWAQATPPSTPSGAGPSTSLGRSRSVGPQLWTTFEDESLKALVEPYAIQYSLESLPWHEIHSYFPYKRSLQQIKVRWMETLQPGLRKGKWTTEEDELLEEAYSRFGGRWAKVAEQIEGRTQRQCRTRWLASLKRRSKHAES